MTSQEIEREIMDAELSAKRAVRHLLHDSRRPALLLRTWTRETHTPVTFPQESIFDNVALGSGCHLAKVVRPFLGSYDHYLFLAKVNNLTDDQLMACRNEPLPKR